MEIITNEMDVEIENIFKYFGYNALSKLYHTLNQWDMIRHQDNSDICNYALNDTIDSYFGSYYYELKIDYDNKTYKVGNFTIGADKVVTSKLIDEKIEELKMLGFKEEI